MTKLQSFRYKGDRKNFNFDKYASLHVEQHNQHADLQEYGVGPLAKNLKTLWFKDGNRDPSLNAVKAPINANRAKILLTLTLLRTLMWNLSTQKIGPMTQGTDNMHLLLAVGVEVAAAHASRTKDKSPRPLTNARRGLFPNLK